ncbi:MAG: transcription termination/antitermination protein NusG [Deferribacterota bacterium]|nr:transcription termination/antitermination protein NusG [Deferribacterota bacterium]
MANNWYVVHTYSGFEKKVKQLIEEKVKNLGKEKEIDEILIPTEDVVELRKGKKIVSKKKTFPGYILVHMEMTTENWQLIKNTPRVTGFVGGTNPVAIPENDVKAMVDLAKSQAPRMAIKFIAGDKIEVIDGPFQGFTGIVDEVNPEKEKVKVVVSIFGRQTPIELDYYQINRIG